MSLLAILSKFWPHIIGALSFLGMFIWGYFKGKASSKAKQAQRALKDLKVRTENASQVRDDAREVKAHAEEILKGLDTGKFDTELGRLLSGFPVKDKITK